MGLEIGSRVSKVVVLVRVMVWGIILGVWLRIDLIARTVVGWKSGDRGSALFFYKSERCGWLLKGKKERGSGALKTTTGN